MQKLDDIKIIDLSEDTDDSKEDLKQIDSSHDTDSISKLEENRKGYIIYSEHLFLKYTVILNLHNKGHKKQI